MKISLRVFYIKMFPNYVVWFEKSIFAFVFDYTNHEVLAEHGRSQGHMGSGWFPPENFVGPQPLEHQNMPPFQNRLGLVLVIEIFMEKEKLIPRSGFTECCKLRTRKGKAPPLLYFARHLTTFCLAFARQNAGFRCLGDVTHFSIFTPWPNAGNTESYFANCSSCWSVLKEK